MQACCKVGLVLVAAAVLTAGCTHLSKAPPGPPNFAPDPGIDEARGNRTGVPRQLTSMWTPALLCSYLRPECSRSGPPIEPCV